MIEWVQNIKCVLALYILPSSIYCLIVSRLTVLVMPGRDDWQKCLFEISQMRDFHNCRLEVLSLCHSQSQGLVTLQSLWKTLSGTFIDLSYSTKIVHSRRTIKAGTTMEWMNRRTILEDDK